MPGIGTTGALHQYVYRDEVKNHQSAVFYYRLKQVDRSGGFSYSNTVKLMRDGAASFTVWPNPVHDKLSFNAWFTAPGKALIKVYDNAGRLLYTEERVVTEGSTSFAISLPLPVNAGLVYLQVTKDNTTYKQALLN